MNKLAIFVEGYTEIASVEKLIYEIAGINNVLIEHRKIYGGRRVPRTTRIISGSKPNNGQNYYVLLFDCGGDQQVKTRILEEHENLSKLGYIGIIGLRDVRPNFNYADISKLEANLTKYIKKKFIPVTFILEIMEIEAWFLAETTHFARIDPSITIDAIKNNLGFDPENDNLELRLSPADDINNCYAMGGKVYNKLTNVKDTIDVLDYVNIYVNLRNKIGYMDRLIKQIDLFLT